MGGEAFCLDRPVYGASEAAALLGLRRERARAWLDGYERHATVYRPVIRVEPTGEDIVTWGEFVELGYLREYRRKGVSLQQLRPVIVALRREFSTAYPLATTKPYIYGCELVLELQRKNEAKRFFTKVELNPSGLGEVVRLHPAGATSPVVIDLLVRFGRPTVEGVATERLWELHDAGEVVDEIAEGYDMSAEFVRAAVAYGEQQRSSRRRASWRSGSLSTRRIWLSARSWRRSTTVSSTPATRISRCQPGRALGARGQ